jgi:hypothetical protein
MIAYRLYKEGKHTFRPSKGREHVPQLGYQGVVVRADEIADYCNEYFWSAVHAWSMTKTWGMAFSGGWAEQPVEYLDAITAIEYAQNEWESEQMEKQKTASTKGKSKK